MTILAIWLGSGLAWTAVAVYLLWLSLRELRNGHVLDDNELLDIQRRANVVLFGILLSGLLVADLVGVLSLVSIEDPSIQSFVRVVSTVLVIAVEWSLGLAVLHLWNTRRRLDAAWDAQQQRQQRQQRSGPPAGSEVATDQLVSAVTQAAEDITGAIKADTAAIKVDTGEIKEAIASPKTKAPWWRWW